MDAIKRLNDFEITVSEEELARFLGYGQNKIPARVQKVLTEVVASAHELIDTKCAYRHMKRHDLSHSPYLYHTDAIVLCLVTIGGRLEATAEEYKQNGELGRALVLDSYGSAAVEAAADAAQAVIRDELSEMGLHCSDRFSPGYTCWDVKAQKWILPALESESLGVRLTEGFMMVPRKSITFAVVCGDSPFESRYEHTCDVCGMVECLHKKPVE